MNKTDLNQHETQLLDQLNYKAKLILDLERIIKENKMGLNTNHLYNLSVRELEDAIVAWTNNRKQNQLS